MGEQWKLKDLAGRSFGRLTVATRWIDGGEKTKWLCRCDCGNYRVVRSSHLLSNATQSCGCLQKERCSVSGKISNRKHGFYTHPLYDVWAGMKERCQNPKNHAYANYGGRGIAVCPEWDASAVPFILWALGSGWKSGLSLDRIDVNGNYEPLNCRFATAKTQCRNKRTNVYLEARGQRKTVAEWSEISGNSHQVIMDRVRRGGWDIEKAIFTPPTIVRF